MRYLIPLIALLLLYACDSTPKPDTEQHVFGACYRSYVATLNAWTDQVGRVPDGCDTLDREYTIQLSAEADIPCALDRGPDELTTGCTEVEERTIYLLDGRPDIQLVDSSVHEWIHAIANCADGDPDRDHLRGELWEGYGANTVEIRAQTDTSFVIGECAALYRPPAPMLVGVLVRTRLRSALST
jgi:hypothetical protein